MLFTDTLWYCNSAPLINCDFFNHIIFTHFFLPIIYYPRKFINFWIDFSQIILCKCKFIKKIERLLIKLSNLKEFDKLSQEAINLKQNFSVKKEFISKRIPQIDPEPKKSDF